MYKKIIKNIEILGTIIFALIWYFHPDYLLDKNFELSRYDDIHRHFSRVIGLFILMTAILSYYIKDKRYSYIKLVTQILIVLTMIYENKQSQLMRKDHKNFSIVGMIILILITLNNII